MIDIVYQHPEGRRQRVRKVSPVQTRRGTEQYERDVREALANGSYGQEEKEVPTFDEWFNGQFWRGWVIAQGNKPSEQESKKSIYKCHLAEPFGHLRLNEIATGSHIDDFKASLIERKNSGKLTLKTINNILAPLSKALRYAEDKRVIERAPKIGVYKTERAEIVSWELEEYPRILAAAKAEDPKWYAAVCLAGEAGLRVGEIRALKWERDIDLIAGTLTVNEQTRKGITGTPKGRTRRSIPMTATLLDALKRQSVVRRGFVVRNDDGSPLSDGQTNNQIYRLCRLAGLPERAWHILRHTFGTHAALFGVNPWRLQLWLGHKRIDETMRYVHVASDHMRPIPKEITAAARGEDEPDRRIVRMLGARSLVKADANSRTERRGLDVPAAQ